MKIRPREIMGIGGVNAALISAALSRAISALPSVQAFQLAPPKTEIAPPLGLSLKAGSSKNFSPAFMVHIN